MLLVGSMSLPSTWTAMKPTDQCVVVTVPPQSPEYNIVKQQFAATAGSGFTTIVKVN